MSSTVEENTHLEEELLQAARRGIVVDIVRILEENKEININCKGKNKWNLHWTPLHLASYFGHVLAARTLLEYGANPSEQNGEGDTPLHKAALTGRESLVMVLLANGADVFIINEEGHSAQSVANDMYIKNILMGAEIADKKRKQEKFFQAVKDGDITELQKLLTEKKSKGNPDVNAVDVVGNSVLHSAAHRDQRAIAILLLQCGANPNLKNRRGLTPIDLSQSEQMSSILKVAPLREIRNKVSRFEGALIRKKKLLGNQAQWAVLERGVISYFKNRADASTGSHRKRFRYLQDAMVVLNPRDERNLNLIFSDSSTESLSFANALDRNRWQKALHEHIEYRTANHTKEEIPEKGQKNDQISLGSIQDAFETAQAQQQLLSSEITEMARLHTAYLATSFESGDFSIRAQNTSHQLREQLQKVAGMSEATLKCLDSCLVLMKQQEEGRSEQLAKEIEKNRSLRETLEAFAIQADKAQSTESLSTEDITKEIMPGDEDLVHEIISSTKNIGIHDLDDIHDSWQSAMS